LRAINAIRSRDIDAQIAARQQLIAEFPRDSFNRGLLANQISSTGKPDQALEIFQQGLALDPKNEDLLNFKSYHLATWGDFNGALAANDAYSSVRPGDPNPLDTRGDILFMAGRDDDAIAAYRKVL